MILLSVHNSYSLIDESFENYPSGDLQSNSNWEVAGTLAYIQTNQAEFGNALLIKEANISQSLITDSSLLWTTFWEWREPILTNTSMSIDEAAGAVFFINTNQNIVVYSNQTPVVVDCTIPHETWVRYDVFCDYELMQWNLNVNGTNIIAGIPFYSNSSNPDRIEISNMNTQSVFIDSIYLTDQEPLNYVSDFDGDSLPDWWEKKYFGTITSANSNEVNINSYRAGLAPDEVFSLTGFPPDWVSQPSRIYSIYSTTNLLENFTLMTNQLYGSPDFDEILQEDSISTFYRVHVDLDF